MSSEGDGVPFAFFCSLLREISRIKPRNTTYWRSLPKNETRTSYVALDIFSRWLNALRQHHSPLPPGTTIICFHFLFPEEDTKRKYEIQEKRLVAYLSEILGISRKTLESWDSEDASGCLGNEVMRLLEPKFANGSEMTSGFTISQVDDLLNELAATSEYSDASIRARYPTRRTRADILKILFRQLPPQEAAFMTHIILKDLRPILYPSPDVTRSVSLLDFNTNAVKMLQKEHALAVWDPTRYMQTFHRIKANLDEAAAAFELPNHAKPPLKPIIGSMIQLPKSVKGTGCENALSHFEGSVSVWVETKYDGERAQIHVEVLNDGNPKITIFSKSKKDSTMDRLGVHNIISEALGLVGPAARSRPHSAKIRKNIVLDAEMVAWDKDHIGEFWRIDGLISQTGAGARARRGAKRACRSSESEDEQLDSPSTLQLQHLALVFFDILVLDDNPLIFQAYSTRRQLLETLVHPIPSKVMFSERYQIDMSGPDPVKELQDIFAEQVANHREGIVLKAEESEYNEFRFPWVKLKQDYIPGLGDCLDLIIVAAGWDRDRARELRVTPNVYTTFWVGAITNTRDILANPNTRPHVFVFFTVSYGLGRKELENLNFRIRSSTNVPFPATAKDYHNLPFLFMISPHLSIKPQVVLSIPLLAEILGAGFTKARDSKYYELRFPRIEKIHAPQERPWTECIDINDLQRLARDCIGIDRPSKDIDDWCNTLWGKPSSPPVRQKIQDRVQAIRGHLENLEGNMRDPGKPSKRRKLVCVPQKVSSSTTSEQHGVEDARNKSARSNQNHRDPSSVAVHGARPLSEIRIDRPSVQSGVAVSCFMKSNGNLTCEGCSGWKSAIPRDRRVHSVESLITACGTKGSGLVTVNRGLIFVHSDDTTMVGNVIKKVQERHKDVRSRILVFACNSDKLVEENALFVLS